MDDAVETDFFGFPNPTNSVSVLNNGAATQVDIYESSNTSISGTWTMAGYVADSWQVHSRLTVNLGVRFDRHRAYLPDQTGPGGQSFSEVSNAVDFNNWAPRLGASWQLGSDRRTIVKATYGMYWLYPGSGLGASLNPNASMWFRRYAWADTNGSGQWESVEESRLISVQGGSTSTVFDPDLENTYVRRPRLSRTRDRRRLRSENRLRMERETPGARHHRRQPAVVSLQRAGVARRSWA